MNSTLAQDTTFVSVSHILIPSCTVVRNMNQPLWFSFIDFIHSSTQQQSTTFCLIYLELPTWVKYHFLSRPCMRYTIRNDWCLPRHFRPQWAAPYSFSDFWALTIRNNAFNPLRGPESSRQPCVEPSKALPQSWSVRSVPPPNHPATPDAKRRVWRQSYNGNAGFLEVLPCFLYKRQDLR